MTFIKELLVRHHVAAAGFIVVVGRLQRDWVFSSKLALNQ